jgi:hypothetical protein
VLATWSEAYVGGLTATRYREASSSQAAISGVNDWLDLFAAATRRAVADALSYEERVQQVKQQWRKRLGHVRADAAASRLIDALPGAPMVTVQTAAPLIGRSEQAVNDAISRLVEADILKQTTAGHRNRAFEATELIDAFTDLERQLASPDGDTLFSPPERRVPYRQMR